MVELWHGTPKGLKLAPNRDLDPQDASFGDPLRFPLDTNPLGCSHKAETQVCMLVNHAQALECAGRPLEFPYFRFGDTKMEIGDTPPFKVGG